MVSRKDDTIDFGKLEDEVHAAVEADGRYWRENDAKFRAVDQKVANYDEFRDIVLAAHLRPLEKDDRIEHIDFVQPWNSQAGKPSEGMDLNDAILTKKFDKIPSNGMEFGRDWRRVCKTNKDKNDALIQIGGEQLGKIFHNEISFGLLGEFLIALDSEYQEALSLQVLEILFGLSTTNRFSLSVQFLSGKENDSLKTLYEKCSAAVSEDDSWKDKLETIKTKYEL